MKHILIYIYHILVISWYLFFVLAKSKLSPSAEIYLKDITYYLKIFIGLVLAYYFNPLNKYNEIKKIHRSMIFTAACFILFSTTFDEFINKTIKRVRFNI